jgi:hypothetical protein
MRQNRLELAVWVIFNVGKDFLGVAKSPKQYEYTVWVVDHLFHLPIRQLHDLANYEYCIMISDHLIWHAGH